MPDTLATNLCGIPLRNPVILAAGCAGVLDEMAGVLDLSRVGAVTTKSITREAREGNATWRILEAGDAGMLNAIGLANPGLDAFLEHHAPRAAALACPVIASAAGFSIDDYVAITGNLDEWADRNIVAVELNVSCPNVKTGTEFGMNAGTLGEVVRACRAVAKRTKLFVKLSPMAPEITLVARAAIAAGADALTLTNTIPAMAIDVEARRPRLANGTGGLSGPALHPIVTRLIHEVYTKVCRETLTPIIGLGGVLRWEHAAEFVLAGATCVGMGTGLFVDPRSPLGVVRGLEKWVGRQGKQAAGELIGAIT
ncbi:MAG: dihydroorotate dehydrogenase [Phycisphaerales bacterium]